MKNNLIIFVLFLLLYSCVNSPEKESIYFNGSFSEAIKMAKSENKGVFLDFYTVWCGSCKSFDKYVFSDSTVQQYIKDNFIFMSVDAEKGEGIQLKKDFEIKAYPTLIIANSNGAEFGRLIGFKGIYRDSSYVFIDKIEKINEGIGTLKALEEKYKLEPDNFSLMDELINKYIKHGKYEEIELLALRMMSASSDKLKIKGKYYHAISWINRRNNPGSQQMKDFIENNNADDSEYRFSAYYELKNYYQRKNNIDSIDYYYEKVIELSSGNWFDQRKMDKDLLATALGRLPPKWT